MDTKFSTNMPSDPHCDCWPRKLSANLLILLLILQTSEYFWQFSQFYFIDVLWFSANIYSPHWGLLVPQVLLLDQWMSLVHLMANQTELALSERYVWRRVFVCPRRVDEYNQKKIVILVAWGQLAEEINLWIFPHFNFTHEMQSISTFP